jgi:hypothetical protein
MCCRLVISHCHPFPNIDYGTGPRRPWTLNETDWMSVQSVTTIEQ